MDNTEAIKSMSFISNDEEFKAIVDKIMPIHQEDFIRHMLQNIPCAQNTVEEYYGIDIK